MSVDDVWRRIDNHMGVFVKGNYDQVPDGKGVYAWFYPLRVTTKKLDDVIEEFSKVAHYDAISKSIPKSSSVVEFNWSNSRISIKHSIKLKTIAKKVYEAWNLYKENDELFLELRKSIMSASLLMPPLYVGKTKSLRTRCMQHVKGEEGDNSNFHSRYESFAKKHNFSAKEVAELIFVCIRTDYEKYDMEEDGGNMNPHSVVEAILKAAARPPYGII
ncbi:hypothetical protein SPONL_1508 [uncultured Candidatus Thioglobus sp.]|nr:hypothetical protein SPONL_1508 [uncultured Candidatus Thioglobus sp.]